MLNDPNIDSPANLDASIQFRDDIDGYKKKVRVLAAKSLEDMWFIYWPLLHHLFILVIYLPKVNSFLLSFTKFNLINIYKIINNGNKFKQEICYPAFSKTIKRCLSM